MSGFAWTPAVRSALTVRDQTLEAVCYGPSPNSASNAGPTIVLLHEGLGCVELWRSFPQLLAERTGCGVFAYSRGGYGASDPVILPRPLDYMTREATEILPDVLDAVQVREAILLGHSDGASIAAIYAGSGADHRVLGLVLIAPHFFTEPKGLAAIAEARVAYNQGSLREKLSRYHLDVDNAFRGWNDAWLDPGFVEWNITYSLDSIRMPVMALQGEGDQYGTIAQIDEIERRCGSALDSIIIPECRHAPHTEQPDVTLTAVAEFVERLRHSTNPDTV